MEIYHKERFREHGIGMEFVQDNHSLSAQKLRAVGCQQAAAATLELAAFLVDLVATDRYGVYHASNSGSCSWYEFAQAIFDIAGMGNVRTIPVSTAEFPRPAPRPAYSVLGREALIRNGFKDFRHWREALEDFLKTLKMRKDVPVELCYNIGTSA